MPTTRILLATTAIALSPLAAMAQDAPLLLDEVVLSGGLTPVEVDQYGRAFTITSSEQIAERGYRNVADALRGVPGITVATGGLNEFRIRGGEANAALVLVDGVEVQLTSGGDYELTNIPVSDIDRIEVLRGPQSALYGASAASGVISIVTKGGSDTPGVTGSVFLEGGSFNTLSFGANLTARGSRGFVSLSLADRSSDGFDLSNDRNGTGDERNVTTIGIKGEYAITDTITVGASVRQVQRVEGYDDTAFPFGPGDDKDDYVTDGTSTRDDDEINSSIYLIAQAPGGRWRHELRHNTLDGERVFVTPFGDFGQSFGRDQTRYQVTFGLDGALDSADHTVTGLIEQEYERFRNSSGFQSRTVQSAALEYRGVFQNGLSLQVGARQDQNEDFEDATTWNLAASYDLPNGTTRLRASAGTGIVNPTFFEQFGFSGTFEGNPDLTPEQTTSWDIGVDQLLLNGDLRLSATYFEATVEDRISSAPTATGTTAVNLNGASHQRGVELAANWQAREDLRFDASYTYLEADDPDGTRSVRRPRHTLDLNGVYTTFGGSTDFTFGLRHVSDVVDQDRRTFDKVSLDDYTVLDLGAIYRVTDQTELFARIENALDTDYEEQWGYAQPGQAIYVGARSSF